MRFLIGLCAIMVLPLWASTEITTQIHDIDHGDHVSDEALVFLTSGQVVKVNLNNTDLLNQLNKSLQKKDWLKLDVDDAREIQNSTIVPAVIPKQTTGALLRNLNARDPLEGYNASVLSPELAKKVFREARHASKEETQCFNRAHIWSYEWRAKHNIYSKKMWIFFTRKYIRRYNFEWWFHVSPMINMIVDGEIKERVMDRKYSSGPLTIQKWANIFLRDDAKCPYVRTYSDHANHPEAGSCFFQKSPMYYYQPIDLEFLEKYGNARSTWSETDVRQAYAEAFEIFP